MDFGNGMCGCHVAIIGELIRMIMSSNIPFEIALVGVSFPVGGVTWADRYLSTYIRTHTLMKK